MTDRSEQLDQVLIDFRRNRFLASTLFDFALFRFHRLGRQLSRTLGTHQLSRRQLKLLGEQANLSPMMRRQFSQKLFKFLANASAVNVP